VRHEHLMGVNEIDQCVLAAGSSGTGSEL
jgi:hypothetical protein